jgi:hypothetical protein
MLIADTRPSRYDGVLHAFAEEDLNLLAHQVVGDALDALLDLGCSLDEARARLKRALAAIVDDFQA